MSLRNVGRGAFPPQHTYKNSLLNKVRLFSHVKGNPGVFSAHYSSKSAHVYIGEPLAPQLWWKKEPLVLEAGLIQSPGEQSRLQLLGEVNQQDLEKHNQKTLQFSVKETLLLAFMKHVMDWKVLLLCRKAV